MFKSGGLLSYLFSRKSSSVSDTAEIPPNFTINSDHNRLLNVAMTQLNDDFIDINVNPLTYAEVAQLSKGKPMTSLEPTTRPAKPAAARSLELVDTVHDDEVNPIAERDKAAYHYQKHREYKQAQKKKSKRQGKKRF